MPVRIPRLAIALVAAGAMLAAPAAVARQRAPVAASRATSPAIAAALRDAAGGRIKRFYAARGFQPLWAPGGRFGRATDTLLGYLETADRDALDPSDYKPEALRRAVGQARTGSPRDVARAEVALSTAFARYVRDQRRSNAEMIWADRSLRPSAPKPDDVLRAAAFPASFDGYLADMGWMSPHYVRLRTLAARARATGLPGDAMARLRLNQDRARLLPGPWTHHIVVDASSGQLWYYGQGKQAGTMRVVVGTDRTQTPMLAGTLQWAVLNPYWNIPTYLARDSIAPKVLAGRSLKSMRIEALTDWSTEARPLPANAIDWAAVASGRDEVRLRELPGGANSMGRVKFLFPNDEGIYLHDTPDRALLKRADRHFSNGCIRLEQADVLGRWLLQRPLPARSKAAEQAVSLPAPVPVYLTYLTPVATERGVGFRRDVYGRDG